MNNVLETHIKEENPYAKKALSETSKAMGLSFVAAILPAVAAWLPQTGDVINSMLPAAISGIFGPMIPPLLSAASIWLLAKAKRQTVKGVETALNTPAPQ